MSKEYLEDEIRRKYKHLTEYLIAHHLSVTTMESATSGQIASLITDTPGASEILKGAFITYSNEAKQKLGVSEALIHKYSVYSKEVAEAMAVCCKDFYQADVGIGVTGTMGNIDPANADTSVPGKVFFAFAFADDCVSYEVELEPQPTRLQYKLATADEIYDKLMEDLKHGRKQ